MLWAVVIWFILWAFPKNLPEIWVIIKQIGNSENQICVILSNLLLSTLLQNSGTSVENLVKRLTLSSVAYGLSLHITYFETAIHLLIIVVIITWPSEKLHKKNSGITVIRACDSFKWVMFINAWCHSFHQIKGHFLCFVVFCLLFSIIVDPQHQVSHSIPTQINYINSKQLPKSQVDPSVVKQFRWECLWCHVQVLTQNQTFLATYM